MKKWVTSDLHFFHKNIMVYSPKYRGHFRDVEEMNTFMINEWNKNVKPEDTVYILGDFAFTNTEYAVKTLNRLIGNKILIKGNHDEKLVKDQKFRDCFVSVYPYYEMSHLGTNIVMFHYPILEWNRMHRGAVHLYGHVHGSKTGLEPYRAMDVSFDATGNVVSDLDDVVTKLLKNEIRTHHGK